MGIDVKGTVSLGLWFARRKHGVPDGALPVPYASGGSALFYVVLFSIVVETIAVEALIRGLDLTATAGAVSLALHAWAVLAVLITAAAYVTRPHVVTDEYVRVRHGAFFDLRIPRAQITGASLTRVYDADDGVTVSAGVLGVAVASQTNVVLTLAAPVEVVRPLGGRARASTVRLYADDPAAALRALAG
ncbi:hypothetical protein EDD29_7377 [Actinocorallia herbida]|uniref:PH (Pleckstrin Homology) domain-containing protein n=2 Tax=Actinocorallia herbida TaxID=58109 RepID=A0A3N1D816_9ACTN|nr:hypothetical protein EDD29_7377 [Actinocorallia herbida]